MTSITLTNFPVLTSFLHDNLFTTTWEVAKGKYMIVNWSKGERGGGPLVLAFVTVFTTGLDRYRNGDNMVHVTSLRVWYAFDKIPKQLLHN